MHRSEALPLGWREHFDQTSQRVFYRNEKNELSQWERPVLPQGWSEHYDSVQQLCYYHNNLTNQVQWKWPATPASQPHQPQLPPQQQQQQQPLQQQPLQQSLPQPPPRLTLVQPQLLQVQPQVQQQQQQLQLQPQQPQLHQPTAVRSAPVVEQTAAPAAPAPATDTLPPTASQAERSPWAPVEESPFACMTDETARAGVLSGDGFLPGDWLCSRCGDHQYARNPQCRMCGHQRPTQAGRSWGGMPPPRTPAVSSTSPAASAWAGYQPSRVVPVPKMPPAEPSRAEPSRWQRQRHVSCLLVEAVNGVLPPSMRCADGRYDGLYVDCTFGRGGHSREILSRLSDRGRLVAFDVDPEAVEEARALEREDPRFRILQRPFGDIGTVFGPGTVNGVLIDLGVSSPQLDDRHRAFTDRSWDQVVDMRMNQDQGVPASEWLQSSGVSVEELSWIIHKYGEDMDPILAERIATVILEQQKSKSTPWKAKELLEAVRTVKHHDAFGNQLSKLTFQAIRIWLNQEMDQMDAVLAGSFKVLVYGGRCCVITFKKLEQERLTRFVREHEEPEPYMKLQLPPARLAELYPLLSTDTYFSVSWETMVKPTKQELEENNRARSSMANIVVKRERRSPVTPVEGVRDRGERFRRPSIAVATRFHGAFHPDELDSSWLRSASSAEWQPPASQAPSSQAPTWQSPRPQPSATQAASTNGIGSTVAGGPGTPAASDPWGPWAADGNLWQPMVAGEPWAAAAGCREGAPREVARADGGASASRSRTPSPQPPPQEPHPEPTASSSVSAPLSNGQAASSEHAPREDQETPAALKVVRAKVDFFICLGFEADRTTSGYLNLRCGDVVRVTHDAQDEEGWMYGHLVQEPEASGWFPQRVVE